MLPSYLTIFYSGNVSNGFNNHIYFDESKEALLYQYGQNSYDIDACIISKYIKENGIQPDRDKCFYGITVFPDTEDIDGCLKQALKWKYEEIVRDYFEPDEDDKEEIESILDYCSRGEKTIVKGGVVIRDTFNNNSEFYDEDNIDTAIDKYCEEYDLDVADGKLREKLKKDSLIIKNAVVINFENGQSYRRINKDENTSVCDLIKSFQSAQHGICDMQTEEEMER